MTQQSPYEKQLSRLIESGQFPEALEFSRAHTPTSASTFSYLVLACHAAFGTGEVAYARLWLGEWLDKKPHDTRAIRLLYTTLLELGEELGAIELLRNLIQLEPTAPRESGVDRAPYPSASTPRGLGARRVCTDAHA